MIMMKTNRRTLSESRNPRRSDLLVPLLLVERMKMNFVVEWRRVERESGRTLNPFAPKERRRRGRIIELRH